MKKTFQCAVLVLFLASAGGVAVHARSGGPGSGPLTMLVIPAHYTVVQVALDIEQHYQSVVLSYQAESVDADPVLYAWNGREWLYISCDDYLAGRFVRTLPERVVLVGPEAEMPSLLADGPLWTPLVIKVPAIRTAELLNALGRVFNFDSFMWRWFSVRYKLDLVDVMAPRRHLSWYDGTFEDEVTPDGTVKRVYIPPEGEDPPEINIFEVDSTTRPAFDIPLKAQPPRMAETIDIEVEEIEPDDFLLYEYDEYEEQTPSADGRRTITELGVQERLREIKASPRSPATSVPQDVSPPRERSVFFEYTEEDMQQMERTK